MNRKKLPVKVAFMIIRSLNDSHFSDMIEFKLKSNLSRGAVISGQTEEPKPIEFWGELVDTFKGTRMLWKDKLDMHLVISKEMDQFKIEIKAY